MNSPEPLDEERIAADLAAIERDAPPPDRAFLDALRETSAAAFLSAAPPTTPRKRAMKLHSPRWIAAVAALLVVGVVFAQWVIRKQRVEPVNPDPEDKFVLSDKLTDDGRIGKITDVQGVARLTGDADPTVRRRSAELLGAMRAKDAVDGLIALTKDADAGVRNSAAHALGQIRDARAKDALNALANDPDGLVRDQAQIALRRL